MHDAPILAPRLQSCRARIGIEWDAAYDRLVERLNSVGTAGSSARVGDRFADFVLPGTDGVLHRLSELLVHGGAVLSFNRGTWCPFCREEVSALGQQFEALGVPRERLVIVTGETGGAAQGLGAIAGPGAVVLSDADLGVSLASGLVFPVGQDLVAEYRRDGIDFALIYGSASGFLPVPATYVLDRDRTVRFAFSDPDFRVRAEPAEVLAALTSL